MSPVQVASGRCPAWPKDALRISFGVIWLIDAVLKWLPGFRLHGHHHGRGAGPAGLAQALVRFLDQPAAPQRDVLRLAGRGHRDADRGGADRGFARKVTYLAAIAFSLLIWVTAEGFGGPYTSGASDIGTAVIYAVVFAALLALSYYAGPSRYSADYYLEKKISWWWRVAETRRPAAAEPPVPADAIPAQTAPATAPDTAPGKLPHTV